MCSSAGVSVADGPLTRRLLHDEVQNRETAAREPEMWEVIHGDASGRIKG